MATKTRTPPLDNQQPEDAQQSQAAVGSPSPEHARSQQDGRRGAVVGVLIAVAVTVVMVGVVYALLQNPPLAANIRDIVIIMAALVLMITSIASGLLLILLLYRLQSLTQLLRSELMPILMETQKTAHTVHSTAVFISRNVAQPTIKAAGFVARFRRMAQVIGQKISPR